jgi:F-type H+-transporting ATPase subunit c|tara:strand:+ start:630 stop:878 length:249 start_codon:yes stop_codon:yes gene_type:complete
MENAVQSFTANTAAIKYMFYFLAMAIAAFGGTAAQSRAASVALEGIARNPSAADKIQTPMILGLALMESLVIFVLISVFLAG